MHRLLQSIRQLPHIAFIVVVLVGLGLPLVGPGNHEKNEENRRRSTRPDLPKSWTDVGGFPEQYEHYFSDNFAFRDTLVDAHHRLRRDLLGLSATPKAALGSAGWIYLMDDFASDYQRKMPYSEEELAEWAQLLELRGQWLSLQKIPFLFVVAPNKSTIYPEYLPAAAKPLWEVSPLDQLYGLVAQLPHVDAVDLRPALLAAKPEHTLYHHLDTHWNDVGAYIAYRALVEKLNTLVDCGPPLDWPDFTLTEKTITSGDLAVLACVGGVGESQQPVLTRTKSTTAIASVDRDNTGIGAHEAYIAYETPGKTLRVLLLRDSFGNRMAPLLAAHCGRLVCGPSRYFDVELIEQEKPDVVILERVERYLAIPPEIRRP